MSSTFGSFNTVRLGIYAAQKGLDVTGNNITNINTTGYTRQRLDQVSLVTTASDRYYSPYKTRVGQGTLTVGVSQLRDAGLDLSYRNATSNVGATDAKLAGLEDLAVILDEVGKGDGEQDDGVILNQLNDLRDLINQALANGADDYDALIRTSAQALCRLFNQAAADLEELTETYETRLGDQVDTVNGILSNLRELNLAIRNADIRGDDALELRDQRNLLLDQLSQYVQIDVKYAMEDVGAGFLVEKMTVSLATGDKDTLVDGIYAAQIGVDNTKGSYDINLYALRDGDGRKQNAGATDPKALGDTDLYGALQSTREMLTEKGEYATQGDLAADPQANVKRGIPYYQRALDNLAYEFAQQMNATNHIYDASGALLSGGNLFSVGSNTNDAVSTDPATGAQVVITAGNISVSKAWANEEVSIQAKGSPDAPSGDTSNLLKFLDLFNSDHAFTPGDVSAGAVGSDYTGSFEDMLLRIQSVLAEDQMATTTVLTNYTATYNEIYMDRESVMGVDLNDEATSLMTYQKAYTAACRLMTVLEEALDSLINGTVV